MVTIGELNFSICDDIQKQPGIRVVEHYRWTGVKHARLYPQLVDILKEVWRCRKIVVDATGIGQPVSSFLRQALGSRVSAFTFTARAKSELGFNLLAAINSGQLKSYAGDGSDEYREFWKEMERAKCHYRPSQTVNFYVSPSEGHDDFLMSLALVVEAANQYQPKTAVGSVRGSRRYTTKSKHNIECFAEFRSKFDMRLGKWYTISMCAWGKRKKPIYTDHARDQMAIREISEEEVEFCLNEPEKTRPGERDTLILTAHPNGRFIKIVVPRKKPTVIITAAD